MNQQFVAVVVAEHKATLFSHPYFAELIEGIGDALSESSRLPVILSAATAHERDLVVSILANGGAQAAILVSLKADDDLPSRLVERGVPIVMQGKPPAGVDVSYVDVDNIRGGALAVGHLAAEGRRTIATISGDLAMASGMDRLLGYRDGLKAVGLLPKATLEETGAYRADAAFLAMERLLLQHPNLDGLFVASDVMAEAAVRALTGAGRRIPDDVAVIGYDDSPIARAMRPPLSSVRQPTHHVGRKAAELALRLIDDPSSTPLSVVLRPELVRRESTIGSASYG